MNTVDFNEELRILSLCALGILDTPAEERFDKFTRLATCAFQVPIALVSIVDSDRQWFKSRQGLEASETPRSMAFCSYAIESDETLIINDTLLDERFMCNPLVLGAPHIRFYAGHPIRTVDGSPVGTLCIIDTKPRQFDASAAAMLRSMADMVEAELNRERLIRARVEAQSALHELNVLLEARVRERTLALEEKNESLHCEIKQRREVERNLRRSEERIRTIVESSFSAFVAADLDGTIIEWNGAAERVFGWSREDALGRSLASTIIPERFRAAHEAGMARFVEKGHGENLNKVLQLKAQTQSDFEISIEMSINTFTVDGLTYFGAFIRDVSEAVRARQALEQKQELLDAVLETVDVAVIACDGAGSLTFFNRAAREMHGQQASAVETSRWADHYDLYHPDGHTRLSPAEIPLLQALSGEIVKNVRIVIAPRGMQRRTVLASGRILKSVNGERLGAVVAMKDITELNEWQLKLRSSEQMLRSITENLPTLIGKVDRSGKFEFLNSRSLNFYGLPSDQLLGKPVRAAYTAEEYAKIEPHVTLAARGVGSSFESEIFVRGKQFHYHASFVPHFDDQGSPDGYFAMAFDITARCQSELLQRESEERLRTITDNVPVLIAYFDTDFRYQFANAIYKDWLGVPRSEMIGRTISEVFGPEYFQKREQGIRQALGGHMANVEVTVNRKGHERILNTTYMPHHRDGAVIGVYVLATDSTAARKHEAQLMVLANADPLTNLPNRRMYEFHLARALALAKRQQTQLALMYLDLDNFKAINDTHGHATGDAVLIEFGRRVNSVLRASDMLARLSGDEFTIVLEDIESVQNCELVAKKIHNSLREAFNFDGNQIQIFASIGIALTDEQSTLATLATKADAALYKSKRNGKNRYAVC